MSSILKVDTINEVTSANGVTVDGLSIKDSKLVTADSVVTTNITNSNITNAKLASGSFSNITGTGTLTSFRSTGIDDNADALAITIDSNEQVGIGTGSPSEKLHIETSSGDADVLLHAAENNSGSDARLFLKTTNTSATPSLFFGDSANDGMGYVKYLNNGNSMQFGTNAAHQWSLDSSGNFLPAATDHGIYLGTTSATAANLLDDYEEGTFTPSWAGNASVSVASGNYGYYTKIGNVVTVYFGAVLSSTSNSYYSITNAPFLSNIPSGSAMGSAREYGHTGYSYRTIMGDNSNAITMVTYVNNAVANAYLTCELTYRTD